MKQKITCPVCDRKEIDENICPNCETDLSLIRMLMELPPQKASFLHNSNVIILFVILTLLITLSLGWLNKINIF